MYRKSSLLLATALAFAGSAMAAPVTQFAPGSVSRAHRYGCMQSDGSGVILVQNRGRGGGGQRAAGGGSGRAAVAASAPPPETVAAISTATIFIGTHRTLTGIRAPTGMPTSTGMRT